MSKGGGADKSSLWHWLESAGLEKYYNSFRSAGVTEENLIDLQFQDYDALGVIEHTDRHNLFSLIRVVKRELEENGLTVTPAAASSSQSQQQQPQSSQSSQQPAPASQPPVSARSRAAPKSKIPAPSSSSSSSSSASSSSIATPASAPAPAPVQPVQQPKYDKYEEERVDRTVARGSLPAASDLLPDDDYDEVVDDEDDLLVKPLPAEGGGGQGQQLSKIRVAVRKRPLNKSEKQRNEMDIATVNKKNFCVTIHEPKQKVDLTKYVENHDFAFDEVFGENSSNEEIYAATCKPLINFFINKGKATCFAYGQTGSGKTFTMMGPGGGKDAQSGLYVLAAHDIFRQLKAERSTLQVWVSFFEIYGGKLFDLCNDRKKLVCREDAQKSVNIVGLKEKRCESVNDLLDLMTYGNNVRSTGVTGANIDSSRSHAILQIALKKQVKTGIEKPKLKVHGKFSFIDLAGSERAADTTNNDRQTRLEGAEINKSLLALKECIRALDQNSKHMPFRGSQLTQVLKDSFVGNSRTIMIANISPNSGSCEHTLNTLRYADRVKELKKPPTTGAAGAAAVAAAAPTSGAKPAHNAYMPHRGKAGKIRNVALDKMDRDALDSDDGGEAKEEDKEDGEGEGYESDLIRTHNDLCTAILKEEETIVEAHREQIDAMMKLIKEEMELLKKFDVLGSSVDEYVGNLDDILANKISHITSLRNKLQVFKSHLKEEEALSNSFSRQNLNNSGNNNNINNYR